MDNDTRKFLLKLANLMDTYDVDFTVRISNDYWENVQGININVGLDDPIEIIGDIEPDDIRKKVERRSKKRLDEDARNLL